MTITIRKATYRDVEELCAGMRPADAVEVAAVRGPFTPQELWAGLDDAQAAIDERGYLICLFGVQPIEHHDTWGAPWLLGTHRLDRHIWSMCKHARRYLAAWRRKYTLLTNATLIDNDVVIEWLTWLGFTFNHTFPGPFDPEVTFIQFSMRTQPCANPSRSQLSH